MTGLEERHRRLVALLLERSVRTGTFTLASGRPSPYYVDARITTMSAEGLELVGELALDRIRKAGWGAGLVGGLTMGADPVSYAIARASRIDPPEIDAFSVRKEPKPHGTTGRIEGCFRPGVPVVVTEDVITTGGSALTALGILRESGAVVTGVLAVVDREEGGREAIERAGVPLTALVCAADLGIK